MPTRYKAVLAGTVAVLVGAIAWAALPSGPAPTQSMHCPYPRTSAATAVSPADNAPGGGGIRVLERGFTQEGRGASLGAVVENSSHAVAYRTLIRFRVLDAAGKSASAPAFLSPQLVQEIPVILPGQRIGAGTFVYVAETRGLRPTYAQVASFELEIISTHWLPSGTGFAAVTASDLRPNRYDPTDPTEIIIDYTVNSGYCWTFKSRGVAAVFRDAAGTVIGGSLEWASTHGHFVCSPGRYDEWIGATVPQGTDDSRIEFYPYCDPEPKAVSPSIKPFN